MPFLPSITGNEQVAYDMSRAHSADLFFIKMRAWFWGVTASVATFLLGHMIGVIILIYMKWCGVGLVVIDVIDGWIRCSCC